MLDLTKPMQTRSGHPVIFLRELKTAQRDSLIFVLQAEGEDEEIISVCKDGRFLTEYNEESGLDVINVPEKHYVWLNVYTTTAQNRTVVMFDSAVTAEQYAKNWNGFVKTIKVEI